MTRVRFILLIVSKQSMTTEAAFKRSTEAIKLASALNDRVVLQPPRHGEEGSQINPIDLCSDCEEDLFGSMSDDSDKRSEGSDDEWEEMSAEELLEAYNETLLDLKLLKKDVEALQTLTWKLIKKNKK